ncbi:sigma factor [Paractinoplanes toevensis]|uniref:RNA polymerase sigma-70 region 2 domain-containing protein n=1 Tax=Paractinoplanes toevensis TaxID=571911 RepID=A0A919T8G8_9ACTN|nr:sigma factor [Actinoplanes toevensis]GIM90016.1 hypothetical protein Ato02nite_018090 [Actinoplanes toevensis]
MEHQHTGDREQPDFDEFYRSAYPRLVGQLFSVTGSVEQAEDVVQEAFIRSLSRWARPGRTVSLGLRWDGGAPLSPTMAQRKVQLNPPATAPTAGSRDLTTTTALATGTFTAKATIPADVTIRTPTLWARCPAPDTTNPKTQSVPIQINNP